MPNSSYLPQTAVTIVQQWLELRSLHSGPLFTKISKSGRIITKKLTPQAIVYILQRRGDQAGIDSFSPHDLRRTFVSDLLDSGADIATVQVVHKA